MDAESLRRVQDLKVGYGQNYSLLYNDDLKIFSASQNKLDRVMKASKRAMKDVGLLWKLCSSCQAQIT